MRKLCIMILAPLVFHAIAISQTRTVEAIQNESSVTYTLSHPLHSMESTSKEVSFKMEIDTTTEDMKHITAQADVTSFDSGNSNRDSHAMEVIDALTYPDVFFSSSSILSHGDTLTVSGNLTFHGVTNNVVTTIYRHRSSEKVSFNGNFNVSLTAFKIDRPSLFMMPVNDTLRFTLKTAFNLK